MRIIAGRFRGTHLAALGDGDDAAHLRPTPDRVRESLFNALESGHQMPGDETRVLDLFAGTGALGLEAMSRGAVHCTFVDDGAKARGLLRENIEKTRTGGATKVFRRDATRLGPYKGQGRFDLVFMDPPYGQDLGRHALGAALDGAWLAAGALIVWEENAPQPGPPGFAPLDMRRYGDTHLTLLKAP